MTPTLPKEVMETQASQIGHIIDHLVDALGGEPSCHVRRAVILADIDQYPGTTQAEIIDRLGAQKSMLNRDIEWLYDYGCIMRQQSGQDGREVELHICGYSKKNLDFAMKYFGYSQKDLKNFLIRLINLFDGHKATLRDAKIVATVGEHGGATKQGVMESLYNGSSTTQNRAVSNLIELGIVEKEDD